MRLAALLILLAMPLAAQTTGEAAIEAAARLEAAGVQLAEAQNRRDRVSALTETVHAYEDGLVAMREGLRQAAIREATIQATLDARRTEVGQLLGTLMSMGQSPTPLLLIHPQGPIGTARSGMMVADVTPAIQAEVTALRAQLAEVEQLRRLQQDATRTLQDGLAGAQAARTALSVAISQRTDLPQRFVDDAVQTALLLASADTLSAFAAGLAQTFLTDAAPTDASGQKGAIALPVRGQILRQFNTKDEAGVTRPGIIIAAGPRALVTTPVPATVLYRGPLLNYGNVIILEPAADVLFIIAGLADVFGEAGQVLPAGAPIGLLGGNQPGVDAILTQNDIKDARDTSQTLYLEVREGQSPVDPATWFTLE